ncbi:uncharacterized protein LOC128958238 [Oppia nitens]|uniref:uncharacterized protein LOC128958238 n=1 Tax=Oppia nitens TaxID=1686743 RepID=UPI0023DA7615|nr:uncharacterized protein LOC128958238 [Oppia nitens]
MNFLVNISCLAITLIVIIGTGVLVSGEDKKCDITEEQAESCGVKMQLLNENVTLPKTDQEILDKCGDINKGIDCFQNYAKNCLDNMSARMMTMIARNGKKLADKVCNSEASRKELIQHFNCWPTAEDLRSINICFDKYIVQMESLATVSNEDRIPITCCSYQMLKSCLKEKGSQKCNKPESVAYIDNMATGVTGELVKFVCGKFKTIDDCKTKMNGDSWKNLQEMVASDDPEVIKSKKKYPTPFTAMREIIKKFRN